MSAAPPRIQDYLALLAAHPDWAETPEGGVAIVTDPAGIAAIEAEMAARYAQRGWPAEWAEAGLKYADPYLMVLRDAVIFPDGGVGVHHRVVRAEPEPAGVAVLPLLDGRIVLVRHFRHPTRRFHWEIPRGAIDPGAGAEEAARQELREECAAEAQTLTPLGLCHGADGFMRLSVVLWLARIDGFGETPRGEGIVEARTFAVSEIETMIAQGEITDSFTLAAFLHARLKGAL